MSSSEGETDGAGDIRPMVANARSNRGIWLFAVGLLIAAILLFHTLEARRASLAAPSTFASVDDGQARIAVPPDLVIPPQDLPPAEPVVPLQPAAPLVAAPPTTDAGRRPIIAATQTYAPMPSYQPPAMTPPPSSADQGAMAGAAADNGGQGPHPPGQPNTATGTERVEAHRFANPATTVPKGTVIQAVLESALDSTRGGFARAIVSRDIYGFDGTRVLIQRGSRIIGDYRSDISLGQRRILIQWQRLMRPDGVVIELDSPSADLLGRAGVNGSVNTHFLERFGGAILQSTLDIGVQLAGQEATRNTVVVAVPGTVQQSTQVVQPERIQPTVKVRQGASVSVFVAKDLDFTTVEQ